MVSSFYVLAGIALIGAAFGVLTAYVVGGEYKLQMSRIKRAQELAIGDVDAGEGLGARDKKQVKKSLKVGACIRVLKIVLPLFVSTVFGAVVFGLLEGWTFTDSIYWIMVSGSTVGYGDIQPATTWGKLIGIIYCPIIVAVVGKIVGVIGDYFIQSGNDRDVVNLLNKSLMQHSFNR